MVQALTTLPLRSRLIRLGSVSPELAFAIRFAVGVSAAI
jgi:hypothetical protein